MVKKVMIGVLVLVLLGMGGFVYLGQRSQSGAAPGLVQGRLAPCPSSPNCVSSEQDAAEDKKVDPLPVAVWTQLPAVIVEMGGIVTKQGDAYVAAEFTSDTFGFVDDVELRRGDDAVHVRSASRVGYSDRGVNRTRVAALRAGAAPRS